MLRITALLFLFVPFIIWGQSKRISFIENKGQFEDFVKFKCQTPGMSLFIQDNRLTYKLSDYSKLIYHHTHPAEKIDLDSLKLYFHAFHVNFLGAQQPSYTTEHKLSQYHNYYLGNNPDKWAGNVPLFAKITQKELYPGIDLSFYSMDGYLKYDFIVSPNAQPSQIHLSYEGLDKMKIKGGNLILKTSLGQIVEEKPFAYQMINGKVRTVKCEYLLDGNELKFDFPEGYDEEVELVIDPVIIFSTSSGSTANNFGMTATYDDAGNLISGGTVFDDGFPYTTGAYDTTFNGTPGTGITDIMITKYNSVGSNQIFSTYIGGAECETVHSLIVDKNGDLFLYGLTGSNDYPVSATAYDQTFNGGTYYFSSANGTLFNFGTDIYVTKLNADGTALLGSTYIGGSDNDGMNYNDAQATSSLAYDSLFYNYGDQFRGEIMVDTNANCYVATSTRSSDFPFINGFGSGVNGSQAGVVMKFNSDLSSLIWSNSLNGQNKDAAYSIKVDESGRSWVAGGTSSPNFTTTPGVYQAAYAGGVAEGFLCQISADGSTLLKSSFLGSNAYDQIYFLELDRFGRPHVVGQTLNSAPFPTTTGVYSNPNSGQFITAFDSTLQNVYYGTVFGSSNNDIDISPSAFLIDQCGNIYVSGWGDDLIAGVPLSNMPITPDADFPNPNNNSDFYLIVLEREAQGLTYGTYFGGGLSGEHVDGGTSRFDKYGIVYQSVCAGCQNNDDFPCFPPTTAWSCDNLSTGCNNGVFKYDFEIRPVADFTVSQLEGCAPLTINFTNGSLNNTNYLWDFGNGDTTSIDPNPSKTYTDTGTFFVYLSIEDSICALVDTALQVITVYPELNLSTSNDTVICDSASLSIWASGTGHNGNYIWSTNNQFSDTLNSNLLDSSINYQFIQPSYLYVQIENPLCSLIDSVFVNFTSNTLTLPPDVEICLGDEINIAAGTGNPLDPFVFYDWSADSVLVSPDGLDNVDVSPSSDQYVYLDVISQAGCVIRDSIYVGVSTINGIIDAQVNPDTILFGSSSQVSVQPSGYTYLWSPSTGVANPNAQNTTISPPNLGWNMYIVSVSDGPCVRSDTIYIFTQEYVCGDENLFVPNAFNPNSTVGNELFKVQGDNLEQFYFTVYNRWGEKMFETTDQSQGWDGTDPETGVLCNPDVYVYYLEAICVDGKEIFLEGNVSLLR
jgi:gliding motility-associated-like protein